jgi:exodeoxyribonuclease V alpha subunit
MVLHGAIIKTKYQKSDNSWHIVHFKVMNNNVFTEDITATGYIPWSVDDDLIGLEGEYKTNDYGRQFVVTQSWMEMPITSNGAKKYLQNWVPGIGSSKAEALVKHFGTKLVSILNNEPDKLLECKGINNKIAVNITECWQRDGLARKIGVFLSEHNISTVWRDRIVEKFGSMAVEKITANPYILTSIRGIGFSKADEIARKLGVKKNSSERIKACFIHVLTQWANDGHCFMHEGDLKEAVFKLTKAKPEILQEQLKNLIDNKEVIESSLSSEEINIKVIYLPYLYEDEVAVSKHIVRLLNYEITKHTKVTINNQDFSEQQKTGISNSFNNKISIVTGAPGTGKTSLVKGIVAICNKYGKTLALCAPTGRAAKRLAEVTGEEASTIHRLLEYNGETSEFNHNEDNELQYDVIIVDESSMIDIELANDLLSAIGKNTSIVFVGDIDQLPPVGPGSFLKDMIKSEKIDTVKLDHIFRQAQKSLMVQNSHRIKNGEYPTFPPKGTETDSYLLTKSSSSGDDSEWADTALTMMITKNIPEKIKSLYNIDIDIKTDIQVVVPMKKGTYGVYEINKSLQNTLNPDGTVFNALGKLWRVGDKVLQNSNNYEYDIYNGDIGVIIDYDIVDKTMTINFDGKLVTIPYKTVNDEMSLGYCLTIHKVQGSEYKVVVVVLLWQHYPMLERNLLYTANTRAKLMTLYIAAGGTLQKAVDTNKVKSRNSLLVHRIKSDYAKKLDNPQ